jgi:hypothetical protein
MLKDTPKILFEKGLIDRAQYDKIDLITSGKLISVFYELRTLLYLGIMLFTAGAGVLIYQNIGDIGHIISVSLLIILTGLCFGYVIRQGPSYSNESIKGPTPYFDYIVLLGALLFIAVFAYLQFLYGLLEETPGLITLITAAFFFFIAYRFDHIGVLSLAITAFASFWSISITPQKWYNGDFYQFERLYLTAIIFGSAMATFALLLDWKKIKTHFTFTYINFATLIFFIGAIAGLFEDEWYGLYLLMIYGGCVFTFYMARWKKSFLFLLYAFLAAYIGTTYLIIKITSNSNWDTMFFFWFFYSIASCAGFVYFIIRFKNYFKQ